MREKFGKEIHAHACPLDSSDFFLSQFFLDLQVLKLKHSPLICLFGLKKINILARAREERGRVDEECCVAQEEGDVGWKCIGVYMTHYGCISALNI